MAFHRLSEYTDIVSQLPVGTTLGYQDDYFAFRDVIVIGHANDSSGNLSINVKSIDHDSIYVLPLHFCVNTFEEVDSANEDDEWEGSIPKSRKVEKAKKLEETGTDPTGNKTPETASKTDPTDNKTTKETVVETKETTKEMLGKRVEVAWIKEGNLVHCAGIVTKMDDETMQYLVHYDDGDREWETLNPDNQSILLVDNTWRFESLAAQYIPRPKHKREPLKEFLIASRLEEYTEFMLLLGYDDLEFLQSIADEKLKGILIHEIKMKPGHASKFQAYLKRL